MEKKKELQNKVKISIADAIYENGKVWFCAQHFNGLFCIDLETKNIVQIGIFPGEAYCQERLSLSMKIVDKKIYFAPFQAKSIFIYDMESQQFSSIKIEEQYINDLLHPFFFGGIEEYENYLFILPAYSPTIMRIDTKTQEVIYISDWLEKVEGKIFNRDEVFARKQGIVVGNRLLVPFCNVNAVLELDCDTLKTQIHFLGAEEEGYSGIDYDGERFWLSPRESGDLKWCNSSFDTTGRVSIRQDKMIKEQYAYAGVLCYNNRVLVFPEVEEKWLLDEKNKNVEIVDGKYSFVKKDKNILYYYERNIAKLIVLDNKGQEIEVEAIADSAILNIPRVFAEKSSVLESEEVTLQSVLESLITKMNDGSYTRERKLINGKLIYEVLNES